MQIAEILSDLTSFRVCGHAEAMALVHAAQLVPPADSTTSATQPASADAQAVTLATEKKPEDSADVRRAFDLMSLHTSLKVQPQERQQAALQQARKDVSEVMVKVRRVDF
ncbi:MAG: hypothetical protein M1838_000737 [Thelocarpon superellum]|nr:MAG: hypothetical protein M1838_000737 [Thelocarpon superellum]